MKFHRFAIMGLAAALLSCDKSTNSDPAAGSGSKSKEIPWNSAVPYGSVTDAAGQTYKTVVIGSQTWMAENLNTKVDSSWWHEGSADSGAKYGRLYTWAAVMNFPDSCTQRMCASQVQTRHQGICPTGWHVPNDSDWIILGELLGGASIAGKKLKSQGGWVDAEEVEFCSVSGQGMDTYGFHALPAGDRFNVGGFSSVGSFTVFWSSSEDEADNVWTYHLNSSCDDLSRGRNDKKYGLSVRCLKDVP